MFVQKRIDRKGNVYFSFSYVDPKTKKRIRLKKEDHPHFSKREDALAWAATQDAMRAARLDLVAKKEAWKTAFYQFDELKERFKTHMKEKAPNSWDNTMVNFENHAMYFFLEIKKASNINQWHFLYPEFREWLRLEARTKTGQGLSYSTCNHVIHSVNNFISFLVERGEVDVDAAKKCKVFGSEKLGVKGFESVIEEPEFRLTHTKLKEIDEDVADLFWVLYETGMRVHELRSLPITALFRGELDGPMQEELKEKKIEYVGYIVLESQASEKSLMRDEDDLTKYFERKPLKGRKTISPKNNRLIPIFKKETWNILARRYKAGKENFTKKLFGTKEDNYLFFENLSKSRIDRAFEQVYDKHPHPKTAHDCRHSFCTLFTGKTRSFFLARTILGHKSKSFERYLHLFEQMALKAKAKTQEIEEM
jgi:integrase